MKTTNQARKWTESWVMWPICPWEESFCLMIFVYHTLNTRTSLLFINGIFTTNCYFAINTVKGISVSAVVVLWIFITCQDGMLYQFWGVSSYSRDTMDMENHISHFMGWKILVFQINSKIPRGWLTICKDCPISQGHATCLVKLRNSNCNFSYVFLKEKQTKPNPFQPSWSSINYGNVCLGYIYL